MITDCNNEENPKTQFATIPLQWIGPVKLFGPVIEGEFPIPLATFETPLWPSTDRGARISQYCEGIRVTLIDERMSRSVAFSAANATICQQIWQDIEVRRSELQEVVKSTSRFAQLLDVNCQIVGNLLYLRFEMLTGDASGHNMVTKAADHLMTWLLKQYPELNYISVSANYCTDKKVSAVNGILGRGKYVVAEIVVPAKICRRFLKTTPRQLVDLNLQKNLMGSIIAGSLRSANAHFGNMLLAFYLATGQDGVNIIEGSQGFVHTEVQNEDLYFSVTIPNVIVGTVGNGKGLPFVQANLQRLGCTDQREPGANAQRLAALATAAVLCGELSLLAALTNPGELMQSHLQLERQVKR